MIAQNHNRRKMMLLELLIICFFGNSKTFATPIMALKEANNCQGCHEPGRAQRPVLWRRCTLDCQGCHIDPNGSGPRNQWGYYYSHDQLASWNFFKPQDPLKDTSLFDIHMDSRLIQRRTEGQARSFPMNHEFSLRLRPLVRWLHFTYQQNYMGRIGQKTFTTQHGSRTIRNKWAIMVDGLPMNLYLRYYQGTPLFGLRKTNHTLWSRERLGLDQFSQTRAFEFGGTPNVPFFHMTAMQGDPDAHPEDRQKGYSVHSGMRGVTLGWNLHASLWKTSSEKSTLDMHAIGGGVNLYKFVIMAEKNWRKVEEKKLTSSQRAGFYSRALRSHPSVDVSEWTLTYTGLSGIWFGVVGENMSTDAGRSERSSYFIDLHPIPNVQLEFWRRIETGMRKMSDSLAIFHLYLDV